jgi:hypothetical protein
MRRELTSQSSRQESCRKGPVFTKTMGTMGRKKGTGLALEDTRCLFRGCLTFAVPGPFHSPVNSFLVLRNSCFIDGGRPNSKNARQIACLATRHRFPDEEDFRCFRERWTKTSVDLRLSTRASFRSAKRARSAIPPLASLLMDTESLNSPYNVLLADFESVMALASPLTSV